MSMRILGARLQREASQEIAGVYPKGFGQADHVYQAWVAPSSLDRSDVRPVQPRKLA